MNTKPQLILPAIALLGLPLGASAQVIWDNDLGTNDLMTEGNWGDGASGTPESNTTNEYVIDSDTGTITWGGGFSNRLNGTLTQQAGTVQAGASGDSVSQGTYNLETGGTLEIDTNALQLQAGSVMNFNGGSISSTNGGELTVVNSATDAVINVNANLTADVNVFGGPRVATLNLNAGTFTFTGAGLFRVGISGTEGALNVGDGSMTLNAADLTLAAPAAAAPTLSFLSGGSGSIVADNLSLATVDALIDFQTGTSGTLTVSGADSAFYESIWDDGQLLAGGAQNGTFADNFDVTGETIALIPEPSVAILLTSGFFGFLLVRRRR